MNFYDLLRIFFPTPCVSCGYLSEGLCHICFDKLRFEPHIRVIENLNVCSALYYDQASLLPKLLHPFKYDHQSDFFRLLVPPMKRALELLKEPKDLILAPVPLHRNRLHERGYNQSRLLSEALGKALGCPSIELLERAKDTGSQAQAQTREERRINMKGAFQVIAPVPSGQVVLVDDIVTTGSTLLACAEALKAAGVNDISALTLADREKNPENPWH